MRRIVLIPLIFATLGACKKEEPPPPKPPEIRGATVDCADADGQDYQVVSEVGIEIVDPDRDLVAGSLFATINGVVMAEIADADADDVFTWTPPASWDPPMVCRGEFRIIAEVRDATGIEVEQTLLVQK